MNDELPTPQSDAIRCLANVCLLHEDARVRLANGGDGDQFSDLPRNVLRMAEVSSVQAHLIVDY